MPSDKFEKEDYGPFPVATTNKDVFNEGSTSKSSQLTPNDNKELKRLDCSINYVIKGSTSKSGSRRGVGVPSIPWNVRWLHSNLRGD